MKRPILALTQGDPAGIGPEILLRLAAEPPDSAALLLVAEPCALAPLQKVLPAEARPRLRHIESPEQLRDDELRHRTHPESAPDTYVLDPCAGEPWSKRRVVPGRPSPEDARAALAALDLGASLVRRGFADALVTAPINKAEIASHVEPDFRGHTDYLARGAGLEAYGRDYLMAFLAPRLRVALLSTHVPLRKALDLVTEPRLLDAGRLIAREQPGTSIVVAGLDPHAGEGGLLGTVDEAVVRPAVRRLRDEGIDAHGPESADSLFARAQRGAYDWVLALYHDQGLIAVKTAAFGLATNWTLGLPFLRTSVDHGTAYDIAGRGVADPSSLRAVLEETLGLLER